MKTGAKRGLSIGVKVYAVLTVLVIAFFAYNALSNMGMEQSPQTILGIKVLCILAPAVATLGSWVAFKYVWNITPEVKAMMAEKTRVNG